MDRQDKKVSVYKVIAITVGAVVVATALCYAAYTLFKKYFKITFDCGKCGECDGDCLGIDFDPELCDEDYEPECSLDDEEDTDAAKA